MRRFPSQLGAATGAHVLAVAIIALVAMMLTLPSLFEIPLALSMLAVGGPAGGAAALLFAGPGGRRIGSLDRDATCDTQTLVTSERHGSSFY
jgi:hypothetical protein